VSLLAVDMGSSSCKAVAFSEGGRVLAQQSCSYSPESEQPGWAEMDPEKFWQAFQKVTGAVAAGTSESVEVLAISSHGETFIPVDVRQQPVGPAILNIDNRAVAEADWLADTLGRRRIFEITGLAVHSMYPIPKILWMREHQGDVFSSTSCFLALPSYLLSRLGLPPYVDYSLASRFLAFDVRQHCWSQEILSACRLEPEQFSIPVPSGTVAGQLQPAIAAELGLPSGTLVAVGGHDQPCSALGCGVLAPGRVSASFGTYECLVAASEVPAINDLALSANLNSYCHVVPDRFVTIAYFPAGIMVEWFLRLLYPERQLDGAAISEFCAALEADATAEPSGLCITAHLPGTCTPDFDPRASGVMFGIRSTTGRAEIYKGILEGIACEFATMADLLQRVIGPFNDVYVAGGGGRSRLGLKLRATLASRRLHLMQSPEAVCLGTAILAGVAAGKYRSFDEAVKQVVVPGETIQPAPGLATSYGRQLQQYRLLYSSLAPVRQAQAAFHTGGGNA
jgi:xylulokinase